MRTAIIVGGGISGIAAANGLLERGWQVRLFESDATLGGRIGIRSVEGTDLELGGRNFSGDARNLRSLLATYGGTQLVDYEFNSLSVGTARPFDMRRSGGAATKARRLVRNLMAVPLRELLELSKVMRAARRDPQGHMLASPYWASLAERANDPASSQYFGAASAESILRPWTLRMMASEPEEIHVANLGPLLGTKSSSQKRVEGGLGKVLRTAAKRLAPRLEHRVDSVVIEGGRAVGIRGQDARGERFEERGDLVVVSTPASVAAELLAETPSLANELRRIVYRPVATVVAQYSSVDFPRGVNGFFLPRGCAASHIASYDRERRLRFSFAGQAARQLLEGASIDDLVDVGEELFRRFRGRLGARLGAVGQIWRPGLCAQTRMHHLTVQSIRASYERTESLLLVGDYFRGNSLEACATTAAEHIARLSEANRRP